MHDHVYDLEITQTDAVRAGVPQWGVATVHVDVAALTPDQREALLWKRPSYLPDGAPPRPAIVRADMEGLRAELDWKVSLRAHFDERRRQAGELFNRTAATAIQRYIDAPVEERIEGEPHSRFATVRLVRVKDHSTISVDDGTGRKGLRRLSEAALPQDLLDQYNAAREEAVALAENLNKKKKEAERCREAAEKQAKKEAEERREKREENLKRFAFAHCDPIDRQRVQEDMMPRAELLEIVTEKLFQPLARFPLYETSSENEDESESDWNQATELDRNAYKALMEITDAAQQIGGSVTPYVHERITHEWGERKMTQARVAEVAVTFEGERLIRDYALPDAESAASGCS